MAKQLDDFNSQEDISNVHQSAYRSFHSTETAVLKIQNYISTSVDSGKAVALTLLDLSAAFHMSDHSIVHDSLKDWFGFLMGLCQKIKIWTSFLRLSNSLTASHKVHC